MNTFVSIIIPVYNEEKVIGECLNSLSGQTHRPIEIVLVDDGSTDETLRTIGNWKFDIGNLKLLKQNHKGPGSARNLGAKHAKGEILVFVDADMTFEKDFISDLVEPITKGETVGTFSKNEMVKNSDNIWSACWNYNKNLSKDRMIPADYPSYAPVFRAILRKKFDEAEGFDSSGEYTDDWSLSRKLGINSTLTKGAVYYHSNPSTLKEVWHQARWIGKSEFISGTLLRKIRSLIKYSFPSSLMIGIYKSAVKGFPPFLIFKVFYDFAIWTSAVKSFFSEPKSK